MSGQFQSLDDARLMNALPRTWKEVYNHGGRLLNKVPSREGFDTPHSPCSKLDQGLVATVLCVPTWGTRPAISRSVGAMGKCATATKGAGLRTKGIVAQTRVICQMPAQTRPSFTVARISLGFCDLFQDFFLIDLQIET